MVYAWRIQKVDGEWIHCNWAFVNGKGVFVAIVLEGMIYVCFWFMVLKKNLTVTVGVGTTMCKLDGDVEKEIFQYWVTGDVRYRCVYVKGKAIIQAIG